MCSIILALAKCACGHVPYEVLYRYSSLALASTAAEVEMTLSWSIMLVEETCSIIELFHYDLIRYQLGYVQRTTTLGHIQWTTIFTTAVGRYTQLLYSADIVTQVLDTYPTCSECITNHKYTQKCEVNHGKPAMKQCVSTFPCVVYCTIIYK